MGFWRANSTTVQYSMASLLDEAISSGATSASFADLLFPVLLTTTTCL